MGGLYSDVLSSLGLLNDAIAWRAGYLRSPTWMMCVDITGAFPGTCRAWLWHRLRSCGMSGALLATLVDLIGTNSVRLGGLPGGGFSSVVDRMRGLPEGFVLSPLLFALAFSPLVDALREADIGLRLPLGLLLCTILFVDDVTLLAASPEDLGAMFRVMAAWLRDARWIVSEAKTHVVVVGPGATPAANRLGDVFHVEYVPPGATRPAYRFDCPIESETRDLGYFFARDLRADATIARCLPKAYPFLANYDFEWALFQRLSRRFHLDGFHAHFRSVVEWAAPVWTQASTSAGYPLQRYFVADHRFVRWVLGTTYVASNPALEGVYFLLNQLPPELRLTEIRARYAWKLDVIFYFDLWRRALCGDIWERRRTHPAALASSSCCRQLEACR